MHRYEQSPKVFYYYWNEIEVSRYRSSIKPRYLPHKRYRPNPSERASSHACTTATKHISPQALFLVDLAHSAAEPREISSTATVPSILLSTTTSSTTTCSCTSYLPVTRLLLLLNAKPSVIRHQVEQERRDTPAFRFWKTGRQQPLFLFYFLSFTPYP